MTILKRATIYLVLANLAAATACTGDRGLLPSKTIVVMGAAPRAGRRSPGPRMDWLARDLLRRGRQMGAKDAKNGVDLGPDMAVHDPTAELYLDWADARLGERLRRVPQERRDKYVEAFVSGYRSGHASMKYWKPVSSLSNLRTIGAALLLYTQENQGVLPPMDDWKTLKPLLITYAPRDDFFVRPRTKELYRANASLSGRKLAEIVRPGIVVAFYEAGPAPDGTRNVVFLDDKAKRVSAAEWGKLKRTSQLP
jgi:hypothetical protein